MAELTKEYFDEVVKGLATVDMVKGLATVEMVKGLATVEMVKGLATVEMVKGLATKDDITAIRLEMATKDDLLELATRAALANVQSTVKEIKEKVDRLDKRSDEDVRAVIKDVEGHEKRITKLESVRA